MRANRSLCILIGLALMTASCGYALTGRGSFLPSYIRVVGVPQFTNATPYYEIEQLFSEKVRAELIGRGRYQVLPQETGVDAVLRGTIQSMTVAPANFNQDQQVTRYVVAIGMKIEFVDLKDDRALWANDALVFREEYDLPPDFQAGNPQAFFGQAANALERVTTDCARTVVSAILEAF
jgi:hypothetical protein